MSQAPADLQNFLQQLQRSGQTSPNAPAAPPAEAQGQPANQWAYLAFLMQQQQQQQQQQQRVAPQDFASIIASLASDPTAGPQLAPLLTAMMQKTGGAGDADGKGGARQGGEGSGEAAFSGSAEGGATSGKMEGVLDASTLLPLLQLQCVAPPARSGWSGALRWRGVSFTKCLLGPVRQVGRQLVIERSKAVALHNKSDFELPQPDLYAA